MVPKVQERARVIALRKKGYSYREILNVVPVSKSSISSWLQDTELTKGEKKTLKKRTDRNISKGRIRAAYALSRNRQKRDAVLYAEAKKEFAHYQEEPLFHAGISLYWAEGAKRGASIFAFSNSDFRMVNVMLDWIERYMKLSRHEVFARLYIHAPYAHEQCEQFWAHKTGVPLLNFKKTVYKQTESLVKRRPEYKGCIRIEIGKTVYLRKLQYWLEMLIEFYAKQRYSKM